MEATMKKLIIIFALLFSLAMAVSFIPRSWTATVYQTIQLRKGTAAEWTTANPVLASGEPGFETDTGNLKIGDGLTHWVSLAYCAGPSFGSGTIIGSTGATDNAIIRANGTAGKTVQSSLPTVSDLGSINLPTGQSYLINGTAYLSNVTDNAQLKRSAADFTTFSEKTAVVSNDVILIEDSAAAGAKKYAKISNLENPALVASENGYAIFPGGLIIQWGKYTAIAGHLATDGVYDVTWPTAFPNGFLNAQATLWNPTSNLGTGGLIMNFIAADKTHGAFMAAWVGDIAACCGGSALYAEEGFFWTAIGF